MRFWKSKEIEKREPKLERYTAPPWMQDFMLGQSGLLGNVFPGVVTTYGNERTEPIGSSFIDYVLNGLQGNGTIAAVEHLRVSVFSEARFQFQDLRGPNGRPGKLFGTEELAIIERPWFGASTCNLLSRMLIDADLAGNAYIVRVGDELVRLRPDWVEIILADRVSPVSGTQLGMTKAGYIYYEGGMGGGKGETYLLPEEVAHFAPNPDPLASYRGMSWLTPVIREIQADAAATTHKLKFFENAATPNLAISLPKELSIQQFNEFVQKMNDSHRGANNAYKTLYTGGGADVTVVGADMKQLDFKTTQGAGETRIANAAGVHAVVAGLSEGMGGSSLNEGNFKAARQLVATKCFHPLWRDISGALEVLVDVPRASRLWYDVRDIPFLQEDEREAADTQGVRSRSIRTLLDAGYDPDAVVAAIDADDLSMLKGKHSGLFSVQLQPPGVQEEVTLDGGE